MRTAEEYKAERDALIDACIRLSAPLTWTFSGTSDSAIHLITNYVKQLEEINIGELREFQDNLALKMEMIAAKVRQQREGSQMLTEEHKSKFHESMVEENAYLKAANIIRLSDRVRVR